MHKKADFSIQNKQLFVKDGRAIPIKKIKIIKVISNEGANSTVFLAKDEFLDREVALKIWSRIDFEKEGTIIKAKKECRKIASLRHPNIAQIYSAEIVEEHFPIAILELLSGITLKEWLKSEHAFQARKKIWNEISDALEYCHEQGVVHGDLHSNNIKIDNEKIKIFDFSTSVFSPGNSFKRASKCLFSLSKELFFDLPLSIIEQVDDPEITRIAVDSVLSIKHTLDHLRLNKKKLEEKSELSEYEYRQAIINITMIDMMEAPVLKFDKLEEIIKTFYYPTEKYKKVFISEFYNYLYTACDQAIREVSSVDVPVNMTKDAAVQKYFEWKEKFLIKKSLKK